jgi:hypothetical protein
VIHLSRLSRRGAGSLADSRGSSFQQELPRCDHVPLDRKNIVQIAIHYFCGKRVIKAPIFGVPIPVARSYPGVVGNKPLLLVV